MIYDLSRGPIRNDSICSCIQDGFVFSSEKHGLENFPGPLGEGQCHMLAQSLIKFLQLMKEIRTGSSHKVLVYCTLSYNGEYLCQVITKYMYLKPYYCHCPTLNKLDSLLSSNSKKRKCALANF